ncbi:MAG: acyltransferase domain-containing protein [Christensenellales bacterium]
MTNTWWTLQNELRLPDLPDYLGPAWTRFLPLKEELTRVPFINPVDFALYADWFGFEDGLINQLKAMASRIDADARLKTVAVFLNWAMFSSAPFYKLPDMNAPEPGILGEDKGLFSILLLTRQVPHTLLDLDRRGIARADVMKNFKSLKGFAEAYKKREGAWGMDLYFWNALCVTPYLNTAHHLRFNPVTFDRPYTVYRHRDSGDLLCLADGGEGYHRDGLPAKTKADTAFTTVYENKGEQVLVHRVSPSGFVFSAPAWFDLRQYERLVDKHDVLLSFHIPTGEGYTVDNCKRSFDAALAFFKRHFPEIAPKGFYCDSWLFSPQLPLMLSPEESRIIQIQRETFMIPLYDDMENFATFVYQIDRMPENKADLAQDSRLRRVIREHLLNGHPLTGGGMVLPLSELHRFGNQPYFRQEDLDLLRTYYQ